jgi:cyclophilin family peptidyl-prolyl cis-trans isomerase
MAHVVFISYSTSDKSAAAHVCSALEESGLKCWIAPRDIVSGTNWSEAILHAITRSRVMVLIFSSHANESQDVQREVNRAASKGIVVVPFFIEKVQPVGTLEYYLSTLHWCDASVPPLRPHILRLVEDLKALLKGPTRKAGVITRQAPSGAVEERAAPDKAESNESSQQINASLKPPNPIAIVKTNLGTIRFELLEDEAPKTAENFRLLAEAGKYDGVIFHRVIKGFMIQGGDPTGTGRGGQSAWGGTFKDEIDRRSELYRGAYAKGTVAMANAGPNTNGSQFFIMHSDYPLPPNYTKFGRVVEGQDVVDQIATTQTDRGDRPVTEVRMEQVTIEEA